MTLRVPTNVSVATLVDWGRKAADAINQTIAGLGSYLPLTGGTLTGDLSVPDEVYGVGWNGSLEVPTKNALYDKIETISAGGLSDGDKGDIVVSSSGAVWEFDTGVVTAFAKTFLDDANAAAVRTTLGAQASGSYAVTTNNLSDLSNAGTARTNLGLVAIAASGSAGDLTSGTVAAARMPALTGDITTSAGAVATTLATVNGNVGTFGSASAIPIVTANAKGLITAVSTAAPARVLITETTTSGSATNVSFTSIPGTYRDLEVRVRGRGTKVAAAVDIRMRFNADTGANYDNQIVQMNNATPFNSGFAAETSNYLGDIAAASATAGIGDSIIAHIMNYRGTTFQKSGTSEATRRTGTTAATQMLTRVANWWRSTSAITQIDVFPSGNAFVDGTVVSLYGLM